jgi:hypothetical protein
MKYIPKHRAHWLGILMTLFLSVIIASSAFPPVQANQLSPPRIADQPAANPAANGLVYDIYTAGGRGRGANYVHTDAEARQTAYQLWRGGWSWRWYFKEARWGSYAFRRGWEDSYVDSSDLAFYVGHGSPNGIFMTRGFKPLYVTESRYSWGTRRNKWIAMTACNTLADSNLRNWFRAMNGTHLVLGFVTTAGASRRWGDTQGYWFAYYLRRGYNMTQAWFKAADRVQPRKTVRVLATNKSCFYDTPAHGRFCGGGVQSWWSWTHRSTRRFALTAEASPQVDIDALNGKMPVYRTPPLSLEESQSTFNNLSTAFSVPSVALTASDLAQEDGDPLQTSVSSDNRELAMDPSSGQYSYIDLANLWTEDQVHLASQPGTTAVSAEEAKGVADSFLTSNELMPDDARFSAVIADTVVNNPIQDDAATTELQNVDEHTTALEVVYTRVLTYTPSSDQVGVAAAPIEFEVVGPGAQQSVYVSADSAMLSSTETPVLGADGGWRAIEVPNANLAATEEVTILTKEQIAKLFEEVGDRVALNNPPVDWDERNVTNYTVAYWEDGAGMSQDQLTPVYGLTVQYMKDGTEVLVDTIYIPANATYMHPFARIDTTLPEGTTVGQTIELTAADATQTLADLGYDASLNMTLGSNAGYLYEWFVNEVKDENKIGSGRTIDYTVNADNFVAAGDNAQQQTIILRVTDIGSANQLTSTDTVTISTGSGPTTSVYLPLTVK